MTIKGEFPPRIFIHTLSVPVGRVGWVSPPSYHPRMRILLIALLLILLPLRGWMGDVMAIEMLKGPESAIKIIAAYASQTGATAELDINLAASHAHCADHDDEDASPAHDACTHCSACQICHSVALTTTPPELSHAAQPHPLRPKPGLQFASATPAPRLKPPIA